MRKGGSTSERTYRYKHIEIALAEVFYVTPYDLPAFRARLRHLRNLGLPEVRGPGSGQRIEYRRADLLQLLLALEYEVAGYSPSLAVRFVRGNGQMETVGKADKAAKVNKPYFLVTHPAFTANGPGLASLGNEVALNPVTIHRSIIINLAKSIRLLDECLARTLER